MRQKANLFIRLGRSVVEVGGTRGPSSFLSPNLFLGDEVANAPKPEPLALPKAGGEQLPDDAPWVCPIEERGIKELANANEDRRPRRGCGNVQNYHFQSIL